MPPRRGPRRRPARSRRTGFRRTVEAVRRFRAIADAMGVTKIDATGTEAIRRASNGPALAAAIAAEIRSQGSHPQRRGGSALRHARRDLRLLPPGRVGRRHGRRQPRSRRGARRSRRRSLGQPAARRVAGRSDARRRAAPRPSAGSTRCCRRACRRRSASRCSTPVGGGWRALAKAHMEAANAPVKVVHGYTLATGGSARLRQIAVAAVAGQTGGDARRAGTARAHLAGGGAGARSRAEAARARARRVFRARLARGLALFAA